MIPRAPTLRADYDPGQRPAVLSSHRTDTWLLGAFGLLLGLGLLMVLDASFFLGREIYGNAWSLASRQLVFACIAAVEVAILIRIRSEIFVRIAYPALLLAVVLLIAVLIPELGQMRNGARRWLATGILPFQPSEFAKVAMVLYLARS
ncbi:MAG: FtsW/RodA/SpoVE family cell cycle protein, partial [Deltaproteobacteria bacterium]